MQNTHWLNGVPRTNISYDCQEYRYYREYMYGPPVKFTYITYRDINGKYIMEIKVYPNGSNYIMSYYQNGKLHNDNGPASIYWHYSGQISEIEYWQNGVAQRKYHFAS